MNDKTRISDELLNAFVDNQLSLEEREQLYAALAQDSTLSHQVCELRSVSDLTRLAYHQLPVAPSGYTYNGDQYARTTRRAPNWFTGIAAGLILCVGVMIGWQLKNLPGINAIQSAATPSSGTLKVAKADDNVTKVLFHLNSRSPAVAREALDEAENLLQHYARKGEKARIEFITNGGGIDLLRIDSSPYPQRIVAMQKRYPNLVFVTCKNSIDRLKQEQGITARLLPGTVVIDSGVAQIMRRQQEGWAYIQV
jgi:intracellular sulfur oxidation DsrE/DsrF family protein